MASNHHSGWHLSARLGLGGATSSSTTGAGSLPVCSVQPESHCQLSSGGASLSATANATATGSGPGRRLQLVA
jgi:hypothetical protein